MHEPPQRVALTRTLHALMACTTYTIRLLVLTQWLRYVASVFQRIL